MKKPAFRPPLILVPILLLLLVEIVLAYTNFKPGTYLMGWDNIMPEFNFGVNVQRSLVSVWQGYRGLGLYDGMSQSANLIHTLILWCLSWLLPQNTLRYAFHFGMHYLGGVGMFVLLYRIFQNHKKRLSISFVPSLFYMLNLFTIQMFYTPLEAFSTHFASLPWLALGILNYMQIGKRRDLLLLFSILLLTTPAYFVATLIFPVVILIGAFSLVQIVQSQKKSIEIKRFLVVLGSFFCINAFWLMPFIIGALSNGPVIAGAKINQMSSNEIFLRNQVFGNITDVLLLRGFSLNFTDLLANGTTGLMMQTWRNAIYSPLGVAFSLTLLLVAVVGIGSILVSYSKHRKRPKTLPESIGLSALLIFIASFFMLGNDVPLLSEISNYIRSSIPFFGEAYRFPFTKFSLLFVFGYSLLFAIGLFEISERWQKSKRIVTGSFFMVSTSIILLALPAFTGNLFYENLKINLPKQYLDLFSYMSKQKADQRVALFPAFEYWSWKYYRWGYRGSGFIWQGIQQPLLHRAFDPWSRGNENFYWELSQAMYRKNKHQLEQVLQKYQVTYLLQDTSMISAGHDLQLFNEDSKNLFSESQNIQLERNFGDISLYRFNLNHQENFVSIASNLPKVYPIYQANNNDRVYQLNGDYISTNLVKDANIAYPFRSLATNRSVDEREFKVFENDTDFSLRSTVLNDQNGWPIQSGIYSKKENLIYDTNTQGGLESVNVTDCDQNLSGKSDASNSQYGEQKWLHLEATADKQCLSFGLGPITHSQGYLVSVQSRHLGGQPMRIGFINKTAKHTEIETDLPTSDIWKTSYFVLPLLAPDGLGYDIYLSNQSFGQYQTVNELSQIQVYKFPYEDLVNFNIVLNARDQIETHSITTKSNHINASVYTVEINQADILANSTLILNEAFHRDWLGFYKTSQFPYLKLLPNHVLINNWANGWVIENSNLKTSAFAKASADKQIPNQLNPNSFTLAPTTIYLFFWPQLLEWIGLALILMVFFWLARPKL